MRPGWRFDVGTVLVNAFQPGDGPRDPLHSHIQSGSFLIGQSFDLFKMLNLRLDTRDTSLRSDERSDDRRDDDDGLTDQGRPEVERH